MITNRHSAHDDTKTRLNSWNASYHSVLNLSSSRLLSNEIKIKIYITIIFPCVLCGCENWSLILREERRLSFVEKRVLRKTSEPMGRK